MYILFNKELERVLKHPKDGVWTSESYEEAQELLVAAKEYAKAIGVPEVGENLIIMEINNETEQKI